MTYHQNDIQDMIFLLKLINPMKLITQKKLLKRMPPPQEKGEVS